MTAPPATQPLAEGPPAGGWRRRLLSRLSRRTSSGRFIPEVDGLRFVAIAMVVLFHLAAYVGARHGIDFRRGDPPGIFGLLAHGHFGVEIFFVISGFVLGLPFAAHYLAGEKPVRLRPYLLRRLTRLEPPYVLSLLLLSAWAVLSGAGRDLLPHLLASLAYVHKLVYVGIPTLNPVAWSLEVEVQFYLLAPLLAALAFRWRSAAVRRAGLALAAAGAVALQLTWMADVRVVSLAWFIQFFLAGLLLAELYTTRWARPARRPAAWDALWLACWPLLWLCWEAPPVARAFAFPATVFVLVAASLRGRLSRAVLSNPWLVTIGGMCYSIYLLHYPLISRLGRLAPARAGAGWDLLATGAVVLPPLLAACAVYFALVERPCMDPAWPARLRRWIAARPGSATRTSAEPVG